MDKPSEPKFWRDSRMPYIELRSVSDGSKISYAPHSHTEFSLGIVTEGCSTFLYRDDQFNVSEGTLLMMNPNWVHSCNPLNNKHWAYLMLYIDTEWLSNLRYQAGLLDTPRWEDITTAVMTEPKWFNGYRQMTDVLIDSKRELFEKQTIVVEYLTDLMCQLTGQTVEPLRNTPVNLQALADYLKDNSDKEISLDTMCERFGYSAGHLIRTFKQHFGLTPHAYLINYRIQCGQLALKSGNPISEVALNTGFADQPHFQRTFKRLLAITPKQYRQSLLNQQINTTRSK